MKYLCLAYGDQQKMSALSKEEFEALVARCRVYDEELKRSGHLVEAQSLEWDCATIRPRNGKPVTTDGPFVESKEKVGGLIVIEAKDLNEALQIAARIPAARTGSVEVRPVLDVGEP